MIDLAAIGEAIDSHSRVARVVIADSKGSTPRGTGTAMLVWEDGAVGSIGGGRLEYQAMTRAVDLLQKGTDSEIRRQPLGPALGQCCGGSVTLVTEIWDRSLCQRASAAGGVFARRIEGPREMPDRVARRVAATSGRTPRPVAELIDGWLLEPTHRHRMPVLIYGAGHVGASLARILVPFPHLHVVVADMRSRPVCRLPANVHRSLGMKPQNVMSSSSTDSAHFIVTHEHELDLELCHLVLGRSFSYAGLIGSATKWARFRKRLRSLGHPENEIDRIECPIGDTRLGKHPQAIAVGAAAQLLNDMEMSFEKGRVP